MMRDEFTNGQIEAKESFSPTVSEVPTRVPSHHLRTLWFTLLTCVGGFWILIIFFEQILRLMGIGAPVPPLNPEIFQADSHLGAVLKPNWKGVFAGEEVSTNSHGLRGPEIVSQGDNQTRFLLVGDSFVFGYGLSEDETLRNHLEKRCGEVFPVSKTCVINGGVPGYNLVQDVSWTLSVGLNFRPAWIFLFVVPNDLEPPIWIDSSTRPGNGDSQSWLEWIDGDPRVMELPGVSHFYLANLIQRVAKVILPAQRSLARDYIHFCNEVPFATSAWPKAQSSMLKLKSVVEAMNISLTVVLYPVPIRLASEPFAPFCKKISDFCRESDIQMLNPSSEWAEIPEKVLRWHSDDLHPSGEANRLMADYLVRNLPSMAGQ